MVENVWLKEGDKVITKYQWELFNNLNDFIHDEGLTKDFKKYLILKGRG